jgi:hypothetical protein
MTPIYHVIRTDYDGRYAEAFLEGTFVKKGKCPKCRREPSKRVSPLVIEWEPGSAEIADFTWPASLDERVVTQRVKDCIEQHGFSGATFGPVKMIETTTVKKPKRITSRTKPRVWLPYKGPPLWDLSIVSECALDLAASKRYLMESCDECGHQIWASPPGAPLVVTKSSWDGADIFRIQGVGGLMFVVKKVKQALEEIRPTNVHLEERGTIQP